jgi:hypothetical protein
MTTAEKIAKARECITEIHALQLAKLKIDEHQLNVHRFPLFDYYHELADYMELTFDEWKDRTIERIENRILDLERTIRGLQNEQE